MNFSLFSSGTPQVVRWGQLLAFTVLVTAESGLSLTLSVGDRSPPNIQAQTETSRPTSLLGSEYIRQNELLSPLFEDGSYDYLLECLSWRRLGSDASPRQFCRRFPAHLQLLCLKSAAGVLGALAAVLPSRVHVALKKMALPPEHPLFHVAREAATGTVSAARLDHDFLVKFVTQNDKASAGMGSGTKGTRSCMFEESCRRVTVEEERSNHEQIKLESVVRPPVADLMQVGFLVYMIDSRECRRREWEDRSSVIVKRPDGSSVRLPRGQLGRWLLARSIGSVFGIHDRMSGEVCESGRNLSGGKHRISCDLVQQYLVLRAAIEGVRNAYADGDVAGARRKLQLFQADLSSMEPPSSLTLERANAGVVHTAAAVAFYAIARTEAKWRSRLLRLAVWSKRLSRVLVNHIFAFAMSRHSGPSAPRVPAAFDNVSGGDHSQVQPLITLFHRQVEASLFCSTGERRGPVVLAREAAVALTQKLLTSYPSALEHSGLPARGSKLELLSRVSQLVEGITVRRRKPPLLYESIALVLYAFLTMTSW